MLESCTPRRVTLDKPNNGSSLRLFVRGPQVTGRRIRITHRREHGINHHGRSDNNPTDIQPELIHDILLWLKVVRRIGPICLVVEARADFSSGRNRHSQVMISAKPALTRRARGLPVGKNFSAEEFMRKLGQLPKRFYQWQKSTGDSIRCVSTSELSGNTLKLLKTRTGAPLTS
jgi:hypothetical protein